MTQECGVLKESSYEFVKFVLEVCCKCSMPFLVIADFQARRKKDGNTFHCPNGHPQHYGATDIEKLKQELAKEREWKEMYQRRYNQVSHDLSVKKGQLTKLKNRVSKGVCPCCNRTFENLQRHMHTKHPDFVTTEQNKKVTVTADAVNMFKGEFSATDVMELLERNGIKRNLNSVVSSLYQMEGRKVKVVRGAGVNKVYKALE